MENCSLWYLRHSTSATHVEVNVHRLLLANPYEKAVLYGSWDSAEAESYRSPKCSFSPQSILSRRLMLKM